MKNCLRLEIIKTTILIAIQGGVYLSEQISTGPDCVCYIPCSCPGLLTYNFDDRMMKNCLRLEIIKTTILIAIQGGVYLSEQISTGPDCVCYIPCSCPGLLKLHFFPC